ncbi:hypothetical protein EMPS_04276 [Entomortierella parvispora]|uniref:Uncharacterized protein n=1 Tax=Entomortierella parvispora TaxID=205924 RepID=A0A9P3LVE9_9FUNG|nr:hypothetical protein EMPS_04276 [Entomortierella parvispora]
MPSWGPKTREAGAYISGALFAIGWWFFIDSVVYSKNWDYGRDGEKHASIEFVDWVPGICSTLGLIIINCVDKASLTGDSFTFSDSGSVSVQWIARLFLFIGFSFMAGGLAGSISVMCLKYIIPDYGEVFTFWGICSVVQNAAIMLSAAVLWFSQNSSSDEYNFSI